MEEGVIQRECSINMFGLSELNVRIPTPDGSEIVAKDKPMEPTLLDGR